MSEALLQIYVLKKFFYISVNKFLDCKNLRPAIP